jgi:hypothetical protein
MTKGDPESSLDEPNPIENDGTQETTNNTGQIQLVRVRHFFEFESLSLLKRIEEHTIYNNAETLTEIIYDSREFKPHLEILDSDGRKLVFHSDLDDYDYQDENSSDEENSEDDENISIDENSPIVIELPKNMPLMTREFRTIIFSYLEDMDFKKRNPIIKIPLGTAPHLYLHIKKLPQFEMNIRYFAESSGGDIFSVYNLNEYEREFVAIESTDSYSRFSTTTQIRDCKLIIGFKYSLHALDKWWFNGGIAIGILGLIINSILIFIGLKTNFTGIIAIAGISNTYLILTKGWIFMKDMDKFTTINYTAIYLTLIFLIFFEIAIAILLSSFDFSFMQKTFVVIDQQIKMNITL